MKMNRKSLAWAFAFVLVPAVASAQAINFRDKFSPQSPLWSSSSGN
jgi:hypothetical protein